MSGGVLGTLLRGYRALMPRSDGFTERFCAHTRLIVPAADAFHALLSAGHDAGGHVATIARLEAEADEITRESILAIHRSFVIPFDRSQILELVTALDDVIDLLKQGSSRILRYGVPFEPGMIGMADCIRRATRELHAGMPLLGEVERNVERITAMSVAIRAVEAEADALLECGIADAFAAATSPGHKLTVERVWDLIEAIIDRCEDVADVIDGIVVEQV